MSISKQSTLWSHIGQALSYNKMSTDEVSQYVDNTDKENIALLEDALITAENINSFKYTFGPRSDITESLEKKNAGQAKKVSVTHNGRTGYAPITCTYPDKTESSKLAISDVIVQHIKSIKNERIGYAKNYVFIGIPEVYISKIMTDAKRNSSITVRPKSNEKLMSDHYWFRCNLDNLSVSDTCMVVEVDGGHKRVGADIRDILLEMEQHVLCDLTTTMSATIINENKERHLDLLNGEYHFSIKPTQLVIKREVDIEAPTITDTESRNKERFELGSSSVASSKIARLALDKLKINEGQ